MVVLSGDHPLISAELLERLVAAHTSDGAAATLLTTESSTPPATAAIVRAADGSVERIVETKDPTACAERSWPSARSTSAPTPSTAADAVGGPGRVSEPRRRALPHRACSRSCAPTASGSPAARDRRRAQRHGRERPRRPDGRGARWPSGGSWTPTRAPGSRSWRPTPSASRRASTIGEDTTIWPGVTLRGATRDRRRLRDRPGTTITDSTLGDGVTAPALLPARAPRVEDDASLGPFAYLRPGRAHRRGRQDRHVRRGEELRDRRRREGAPPLLHRRRRRRRGQQHRRREHHRQLRRLRQAPDDDRQGREDRRGHLVRGPGDRRRRGVHWRWIGDHRGRPRGRPRDRPPEADQRRGIRRAQGEGRRSEHRRHPSRRQPSARSSRPSTTSA